MLPLQKVLWPTDFSNASYSALEPAKELAQQFSAELIVLHVVPMGSAIYAQHINIDDYQEKQKMFASKEINRIINNSIGPDIKVQKSVVIGNPAEEIVLFSEKEHANVVVIATHGESAFHNFVFGSVAEKVIRFSVRPVLVIRCPEAV